MSLRDLSGPDKWFFSRIPITEPPTYQEISFNPASGVSLTCPPTLMLFLSGVGSVSCSPHSNRAGAPPSGLLLTRSYGPNPGAYSVGRDFPSGGLVSGGRGAKPWRAGQ